MLFNTDAQIASDAEHFAVYKGVPIVKIKALNYSAFSFGVIFMGPESSANLVKHEYGHAVHLAQIGPKNYLKKVIVPSVASFWLFPDNAFYVSQPWEYIAEYWGDTDPPQDGYLDWADELAFVYWIYTFLVSTGTHATLHTDAYIERVYSYLKTTDGSKEQIYHVLFLLRAEIAAQDSYAIGY